jgi:hypothetical protein
MRKLLVAVAVVSVALVCLPADGHEVVNNDPNDTEGQFDIRWTKMDHTANKLILKTRVSGELQKRDFFGGNFFGWGLDSEAESRIVPALVVPEENWVYLEGRFRNGTRKLFCFVYDEQGLVDRVADDLTAHVGTCPIPKDLLKGGVPPNRWRAFSEFEKHTDQTDFANHNN